MNDLFTMADEAADKAGLDRNLFRAVINQESRWKTGAVSPVGAQGLGQVMPATAANPGYGIVPMRDNSPKENLRFSSEYLKKMLDLNGGNIDLGLASYNAGYGAVLKHKGVPPFPETQDYVAKIKANLGAQPDGTRSVFLEQVARKEKLVANAAAVPMPDHNPQDIYEEIVRRSAEREAQRQAAVPTGGEAFQNAAVNETMIGAMLQVEEAGPRTDWKPDQALKDKELASGILNYPDINSYVQGYRNEQDYHNRMNRAMLRKEFAERSAGAVGWDSAKLFLSGMGGAMADPAAALASWGVGSGLNSLRVARATLVGSRLARVAANAAEGAISNSLLSAGIQNSLQTETSWGRVFADGLTGAVFGGVMSAPREVIAARRQFNDQLLLDATATQLGEAIDSNAPLAHIQQLQAGIDEVKTRMVERAMSDGDAIAAEVWAAAGPGADSATVLRTIRSIKEREDAAIGLDPVHEAAPTRTIANLTEGTATAEMHGMRLSQEATAVRDFAYNLWKEDVDPLLKDMQTRMQQFYDVRREKAKDYAGLANWLDSPGLTLQRSGSKVARMLGAHMFESATGLGKREQTAALNYEILHSRLSHSYIPRLKEALLEGLKEQGLSTVVRHAVGGARDAENQFWRRVMIERTAHRNAIRNKTEWQSSETPAVQRAAGVLDQFWGEASKHMEAVGIEEGKAIQQGGFVGHVPYSWNARRIAQALRESPDVFDAFQSMIQEEFRQKVLDKALAGLADNGQEALARRVTELQGTIAAVQDELAKMETARRAITNVRDQGKAVADELSKLNALRKTLLAQERKLREELKNAPDTGELTGPAAAAADMTEQAADLAALAGQIEQLVSGELRPRVSTRPYNFKAEANVPSRAELNDRADVRRYTMAEALAVVRSAKLVASEKKVLDALTDALEADFAKAGDDLVIYAGERIRPEQRSYYSGPHHYVAMEKVLGGDLAEADPAIILHELAHARTARWLHLVEKAAETAGDLQGARGDSWRAPSMLDPKKYPDIPAEVIEGWNMLENVRGVLLAKYPKAVGIELGLGYAMKNNHELMSQVFNDSGVRGLLNNVVLEGDVPLLRRVWEAVAKLFQIKKRTALSDVVQALDLISGLQGEWRAVPGISEGTQFSAVRGKADVKRDLEAVVAQKRAIDEQRKSLQDSKKQAAAAKAAVRDTSAAKKYDSLQLQLNNAKAALADMQRDPLGWWAGEVTKLRNAANRKADALTSSYLQQVIKDPATRARGATLHTARLAEDLLNENWAGEKIDPTLAENFATMLRERLADRSRTEFDLSRSRVVNGQEVSMLDFLDLDGLAQVKSGSHSTSGRVALAKMGIKDDVGAAAALDAARLDGATDEEMKALQFGLDFFMDTLRVQDHAAMHALRNMTYATRMGKLGMSIVADVPQLITNLGLATGLKVWGRSFLQLALTGGKAYNGKPTDFAKQLAVVAPGALGRDHMLMTLVPEDVASGAVDMHAANLLQRATARGAQFTSFVSGANAVNMAMHRALLPIMAEELLGAVKGKSSINAVRLADAGLSPEWLARIKAQMDQFDKGRKAGDKVNWDKWEDQDAAEVLIGAIHRAMFQTLQKSLVGERPQWMTTSQMGRLIGQFRSFGLTAAEKQTARNALGFQDSSALVGAVMGIVWAGLMYYARIHVNAAGKDDAEKYINDRLAPGELAKGVLSLWNMSGLGADVLSVGGMMFGGQQTVQTGGPAAAMGVLQDVQRAAGAVGAAVTGDGTGADAAGAVTRLLPGANSIPMTYLLNELAND